VNTTLTLDKKHFQTLAAHARKRGQTPQAYVQSLIEADRTFDEILAPVRKAFESTSDEELDALFSRANQAARRRLRRR
jgi:hypothetical protein